SVHNGRLTHRGEQTGVLAGHADGVRTVLVDQTDQLPADLADQHHADHIDGLGRGDAKATTKLAVDAELGEHGRDLRAAAVYHNRLEPDVAQEHQIRGERPAHLRVEHRVAAVLDDDGRPVEPGEPRQGLDERARLAQRDTQVAGAGFGDGHDEY